MTVQPLGALDDDALVPPELRPGYRILRNAGFLPEEVRLCREVRGLEDLLDRVADGDARVRALKRLEALRLRLAASGERRLALDERYRARVLRGVGLPRAGCSQVLEPESPPGG